MDRAVLTLLFNVYDEEELEGGDSRVVPRLHLALAPYKVSVMPLQKNKLGDQARELYAKLSRKFMCDYDETGSIGKRNRRADKAVSHTASAWTSIPPEPARSPSATATPCSRSWCPWTGW